MTTTSQATIRELDHRHRDGIDVRLLWNPLTNAVSVTVKDGRLGQSVAFDVDAREALAAFHHPYAYATDLDRTRSWQPPPPDSSTR